MKVMRTVRAKLLALAALAALLLLPAAAEARWVIPGKGFGHGVGMPQWGAFGMAKAGKPYTRILKRYYNDVLIGSAEGEELRVLIASGLGSISFRSATEACGVSLDKWRTYSFQISSGQVTLEDAGGSRLAGCGREGAASGGRKVIFNGVSVYRGDLRGRIVGGSLYAINKVGIDDYVRGVIPNEVSPSWPRDALRAQAVAARSYALTTRVGGDGYDLYDDTRSQVYGGKSSEAPPTNAAVKSTAGEVVKWNGSVIQAFFFSSSGGRTENSEYGFSGGSSRPWLKSVRDKWDSESPHHRWRVKYSDAEMESRLSGLYSGNLRRVKVRERGVSGRVVRARVIGSNGSSLVSGDTLAYRLGLRSTWVSFKKR